MEKEPLLLPFAHTHHPLVAIGPGDSDINLGSFAQADPEQSPNLSVCGFSCALIMPKCRAFSLFFSPFFPSSNSVLKITQQKLQWRTTVCENLSCGESTFSNRKKNSSESSQPAPASRFRRQLRFKCLIFLHIRVVSQAPRKQGAQE